MGLCWGWGGKESWRGEESLETLGGRLCWLCGQKRKKRQGESREPEVNAVAARLQVYGGGSLGVEGRDGEHSAGGPALRVGMITLPTFLSLLTRLAEKGAFPEPLVLNYNSLQHSPHSPSPALFSSRVVITIGHTIFILMYFLIIYLSPKGFMIHRSKFLIVYTDRPLAPGTFSAT